MILSHNLGLGALKKRCSWSQDRGLSFLTGINPFRDDGKPLPHRLQFIDLEFIGTRSKYGSKLHNPTAFTVKLSGKNLSKETWLIECPDGITSLLFRSSSFPVNLSKVFVSGLNLDSIIGLPTLLLCYREMRQPPPRPIEVFGPPGLCSWLRSTLSIHSAWYNKEGFRQNIIVHELVPSQSLLQKLDPVHFPWSSTADNDSSSKIMKKSFKQPSPITLEDEHGLNCRHILPDAETGYWSLFDQEEVTILSGLVGSSTNPCYGLAIKERDKSSSSDFNLVKQLNITSLQLSALKYGLSVPHGEDGNSVVYPKDVGIQVEKGRKIVIASTGTDCRSMADAAKDCDLLVHNLSYSEEGVEAATRNDLASCSKLMQTIDMIQPKRVITTRLSISPPAGIIAREELTKAFSRASCGHLTFSFDGMGVKVPHQGYSLDSNGFLGIESISSKRQLKGHSRQEQEQKPLRIEQEQLVQMQPQSNTPPIVNHRSELAPITTRSSSIRAALNGNNIDSSSDAIGARLPRSNKKNDSRTEAAMPFTEAAAPTAPSSSSPSFSKQSQSVTVGGSSSPSIVIDNKTPPSPLSVVTTDNRKLDTRRAAVAAVRSSSSKGWKKKDWKKNSTDAATKVTSSSSSTLKQSENTTSSDRNSPSSVTDKKRPDVARNSYSIRKPIAAAVDSVKAESNPTTVASNSLPPNSKDPEKDTSAAVLKSSYPVEQLQDNFVDNKKEDSMKKSFHSDHHNNFRSKDNRKDNRSMKSKHVVAPVSSQSTSNTAASTETIANSNDEKVVSNDSEKSAAVVTTSFSTKQPQSNAIPKIEDYKKKNYRPNHNNVRGKNNNKSSSKDSANQQSDKKKPVLVPVAGKPASSTTASTKTIINTNNNNSSSSNNRSSNSNKSSSKDGTVAISSPVTWSRVL